MKNDRGGSKRVSTTLHVERYQKGGAGTRKNCFLSTCWRELCRIYEDHSSEGWQPNSPDGVVGWVHFGAPKEILKLHSTVLIYLLYHHTNFEATLHGQTWGGYRTVQCHFQGEQSLGSTVVLIDVPMH